MLRPRLNPDVPLLWRSDDLLDIGYGKFTKTIGIQRHIVQWLRKLDGVQGIDDAIAAAPCDPDQARELLSFLLRCGALLNGGLASRSDRALSIGLGPGCDIEGIWHTRTTMTIHVSSSGANHLSSTEPIPKDVLRTHGHTTRTLVATLRAAGVSRITLGSVRAHQSPDIMPVRTCSSRASLLVLADDIDPALSDDAGALERDQAHLVVGQANGVAEVGPLVVPGRTGCLTCRDLHRVDADPVWPRVAMQLLHLNEFGHLDHAYDPTLATTAGALTAAAVLAWIDTATPTNTATRVHQTGDVEVVARPFHPACGCTGLPLCETG